MKSTLVYEKYTDSISSRVHEERRRFLFWVNYRYRWESLHIRKDTYGTSYIVNHLAGYAATVDQAIIAATMSVHTPPYLIEPSFRR